MKKLNILASLALVVALFVAGGIVAADDDADNLPVIADGRMNAYDIAAPVVVYCVYEDVGEGDEVWYGDRVGVDLYAQRYTDGAWESVLRVPVEDIQDGMADERDEAVELGAQSGFALWLNADDSLTVVAPADFEGKTYSFSWDMGGDGC